MTAQGTKAERAEARRRAALSATILAENWTDRSGKGRPTAERRRRGNFILIDGKDAGMAVAVDASACMSDRLRMAALITDTQCHAGLDLAGLLDRTQIGAPLRSCLDREPRGHVDDDREPSHGALRDLAESGP